jgi:RNA polymerase sigma factor (TIGR02999 family)
MLTHRIKPRRCAVAATEILALVRSDHQESLNQLFSLLYDELRAAAHRQRQASRGVHTGTPTLATTALVNEAYLKLVDQSNATWRDRAHFLSIAAIAMRHILVDRARARVTTKRGGKRRRVNLDDLVLSVDAQAELILEIDDALARLKALDPRLEQVVVARFFGGLSEKETAAVLGITVRTVQRDWAKAQMLLRGDFDSAARPREE